MQYVCYVMKVIVYWVEDETVFLEGSLILVYSDLRT